MTSKRSKSTFKQTNYYTRDVRIGLPLQKIDEGLKRKRRIEKCKQISQEVRTELYRKKCSKSTVAKKCRVAKPLQ
jgi:hypothetical protein